MGRDDGKSCLSEASSFAAAPGEPRRAPAISGQGARGAFFWGLFLAKQEKSRVRRAQPASKMEPACIKPPWFLAIALRSQQEFYSLH